MMASFSLTDTLVDGMKTLLCDNVIFFFFSFKSDVAMNEGDNNFC